MMESADLDHVLLGVESMTKKYGRTTVLDDVAIEFRAGEVHALLGENGAGKSTLVKIVAGVIDADSGTVFGPAHDNNDIAMVFQELSVIPEMSILDNLALSSGRAGYRVPYARLRAPASAALASAGLDDIALDMPAASLSLAQRQLLEIARGLMVDAQVLVLDEPTATLSDIEIARVHRVIRKLVASGHAIVYITHRLSEVFSLSDRITVMRSGRVVASGATNTFGMSQLVTHMLGADHVPVQKQIRRSGVTGDGAPALNASGLASAGHFTDIDFSAEGGQILAFFGQIGSGADALVKVLAGLGRIDAGSVLLDNEPLGLGSRVSTQRRGVAYVSADRASEGVFLDATAAVNISAGALGEVSVGRVVRRSRELALARAVAEDVGFDSSRVAEPVSAFSGGNQQKVAIAKALATRPRVLLLNEPTRGVDIGARSEIYRSIRGLLPDGLIVIVYSSDIVEIRELADRVITMYRGRFVADHSVTAIDDAALTTEILNGASSDSHQ
ncbi:sugar ABC transporter ATP-binding protein [Rhodococcus sp. 06-156-3C]|nr:sugar ABC transporter ATP-binding protein [Rhodococcus sp. 06-156-4C]OZD18814.1 sugar ABC transporter ATP-binding protein [Rhodococcus sp. 06-156-3C]OZD22324.1 sugar ABC transporter ATP-binding protein [Rhodococcus sp. 06-156-4a]OZD34130.1 sugar ABC transporter ATP-binding protein [Rhodococcus sp. 06-156-3b]OZD38867.1 sugar ABC transporter ATP-binding protein [Rhodococcus sp. 06-156-3]OZF57327.1 sugar ABC transporter ATP-binding protein [Rhodococcus sp. 06-156-4]